MDAEVELDELGDLAKVVREVWPGIDEIVSTAVDDPANVSQVMIEIWPDSGRIIFIATRRRELGRIVLNIRKLEDICHELASDMNTLEEKLTSLIGHVIVILRQSVAPDDCVAVSRILARSCDDAGTEVPIRVALDRSLPA